MMKGRMGGEGKETAPRQQLVHREKLKVDSTPTSAKNIYVSLGFHDHERTQIPFGIVQWGKKIPESSAHSFSSHMRARKK